MLLINLYISMLGIILVVFLFLFFYMLKNKSTLAFNFSIFSLFNAIFIVGILGQLLAGNETQALFFYKIKSFGALFITPLFVVFLYQFSNILKINQKFLFSLFVVPFLFLVLITTNSFHNLYYQNIEVIQKFGYYFVESSRGPLYFLWPIYNLFMFGFSIYFLYKISLRKNYSFKLFSKVLTGYIIFTLVINVLHLLPIIPLNIDLNPISSLVGSFVYLMAIFYCDVFDVYEINYNLMPKLNDGVIITDKNDEIIFYNDTTKSLLNWFDDKYLGKSFNELPLEEHEIKINLKDTLVLKAVDGDKVKYYLFKKTILTDTIKSSSYAYVFRDYTEHIHMQTRLEELAERDGLTQIYNQFSILTKAKERYEEAKDKRGLFSVTIIDIDNFKLINDNFGHIFGNAVLIEIAHNIQRVFKDTNCSYGRFGGDEFLIICSDTCADLQKVKLKTLVKEISKVKEDELKDIKLSISSGTHYVDFSTTNSYTSYKDILEIADEKMYQEKRNNA